MLEELGRQGVVLMLGRRGEACCCSRMLLTGLKDSELTMMQPAMPDMRRKVDCQNRRHQRSSRSVDKCCQAGDALVRSA